MERKIGQRLAILENKIRKKEESALEFQSGAKIFALKVRKGP